MMDKFGHVLVAEDDPSDAFFLQRAFKRAGIPLTLHFVRDGQEVIDYLQAKAPFDSRPAHPLPELLLLDLKMPRLNGFDVLKWLRAQPGFKRLQVVVFSGSDEPKDVSRAHDLGANSYLVKPHSVEELNALVGRFKKVWMEGQRGSDQKEKAA